MQIQRHRDGTFSIIGLSADDLRALAAHASAHAAHPPRWPGMDATDFAFVARTCEAATRLGNVLWDVAQYKRGAGTYRQRPVRLVSLRGDGTRQDDAFALEDDGVPAA